MNLHSIFIGYGDVLVILVRGGIKNVEPTLEELRIKAKSKRQVKCMPNVKF
jgi:hypothetical protein